MKILILTGSPRKNGNTEILANAFAEGAKKNNLVETVSVSDYKVMPCMGCNFCYKSENNQCVQKDDMQKIYSKLVCADMLVIASPVYFYGVSAQLKAVIDRLHTPMRNKFAVKKMALLLVGGANISELFDSLIAQYRLVLNFFNLEDMGTVLAGGVREKGDINGSEALKKAFLLGASLA